MPEPVFSAKIKLERRFLSNIDLPLNLLFWSKLQISNKVGAKSMWLVSPSAISSRFNFG